jgi:multicomponent Na+:H+ antiporter subunit A
MQSAPAASPAAAILGWAFIALSLAGLVAAAALVPEVATGQTVRWAVPWVPSLGVAFSLFVDGLGLLFALLITGVGVFVGFYARAYLRGHPHAGRFFAFLAAFQASMLGLVLADDIITLFVFWELTTVTSFFLIGFDHEHEDVRRKAWQALLVTGIGGLALLAGLLLLAAAGGSTALSALIGAGSVIRADPAYGAILALVVVGCFTKSAQFPFHFWLPNAMAAPTPVSAYLHSATMVKAGIYLLARLHPALSGTAAWTWTLTLAGAVTAVWAAVVALRQTDLKLALAYTTVTALGTLTMFLGAEAHVAIAAAVTFVVVHALYKSALFLVIGNIDHGAGTRDAERLRGLARAMPVTALAAAVAALSMAGFPPFLGFIGKELKYEGALAVASEPVLVTAAAVAANALMVAIAGIVAVRPFCGRPSAGSAPHPPQEAPVAMWVGPVALAALGLVAGLAPGFVSTWLIQPAVAAILGRPEVVSLKLWHGLNLPLALSLLTLGLGAALYRWHRPLRSRLARALGRLPITGDRAYDAVKAAIVRFAIIQTAIIQNGRLRLYLAVVFAVSMLGAAAALVRAPDAIRTVATWPAAPYYEWAIVLLIAAGALLPAVTRSRLAAICGLGTVGAGIALIFLSYGAPDVAITQLLVELLFVVIIALILPKLPRFSTSGARPAGPSRVLGRGLAIGLAAACGCVMTVLVLAVLAEPLSPHLSRFFVASSVPAAHGRNIVNVILVDFRALDTLGEIVVVAVAALGALALIRLRPRPGGAR